MSAATIPFTADRSVSHSPPPPVSPSLNPGCPLGARTLNPPWSPTDRDRLIFQWVKFDGHKQSWVATQLGMHQTTVSRIVDRYERWIAHGGPSQQGGLSRDERLRAQRWLTYERNEWILNSALRIAGEMENPTDISKSTITRSPQEYTKETQVRTQHAVLHRSGLAARFLRLAHRINMDQQKLVEQEQLPDLEPLSIQDLAPNDDNLPALADAPDVGWAVPTSQHDEEGSLVVAGSHDPATTPTEGLPAMQQPHSAHTDCPTNSPIPEPSPLMHEMHAAIADEQRATDSPVTAYNQNNSTKKIPTPAYPVAASPPEGTDSAISSSFAPPLDNPLHVPFSPYLPEP